MKDGNMNMIQPKEMMLLRYALEKDRTRLKKVKYFFINLGIDLWINVCRVRWVNFETNFNAVIGGI